MGVKPSGLTIDAVEGGGDEDFVFSVGSWIWGNCADGLNGGRTPSTVLMPRPKKKTQKNTLKKEGQKHVNGVNGETNKKKKTTNKHKIRKGKITKPKNPYQ